MSDLPEGPEKSLGFIDDPESEDFTAFLNAAEQRKTVQFYVELPNKRTASNDPCAFRLADERNHSACQ